MSDYDGTASRRDLPWVTIAIAALNIAAFVWEIAAGADALNPTPQWLVEHGGNLGPLTLGGEPWRLLTSMFLHVGLLHIVMNMIGLVDGGRHVEKMYGRAGFLALYLVAGLGGSLASALRSTNIVSAGASGAIFGVFGAFGAFLLLHRNRLDAAQVTKQARGLMIFLAYNVFFGLQAKGIDLVAHFGGLATGFVVGLTLEYGTDEGRSSVKRSILVGLAGTALVIGATFLLKSKPNAELEARNKVHELDLFITERLAPIKDPTTPPDASIHILEDQILPRLREVRAEYERDGDDPDVRKYLRLREEGFTDLSKGLRDQDLEAMGRASTKLDDAGELVQSINRRSGGD